MTPNLSNLVIHVPASGDSSASGGSSSAKTASSADGAAFQSALDAHIGILQATAALGGSGSSATATSPPANTTDAITAAALKQLQTLVANGSSVQDAANVLANALATAVAKQLGTTTGAAQQKLSTLFAQALSPPGTSPPLTADSARTLAQKFRDLANQAAGAATTDAGQQNVLLGNLLDAISAKETPAPTTSTTTQPSTGLDPSTIVPAKVATRLVPIGVPAQPSTLAVSPADPASAASQALATVLAWRDGEAAKAGGGSNAPTVATPGLDNAGTGGDTLLGRMLTRAAVASNANGASIPTPAQEDAAAKTSASGTVQTTPQGAAAAASTETMPTLMLPVISNAALGTGSHSTSARGTEISSKIDAALGVAAARNAQTAIAQSNAGGGTQTGTSQTALQDAALGQPLPAAGSAPSPQGALAAFMDAFKKAGTASDPTAPGSATAPSSTNQTQAFLASIGASTDAATTPQHVIVDGTAYTNATPAPQDPYNVVDQMVKGVFMRNLGPQQSEVRLRLVPESLGDVSVKLVVNGNSVSAQVLAQTADARNALMTNHAELVRTLADAGLKLQHFSVDVSSNGNNSAQPQHQYVPQRSLTGTTAPSHAETEEEEEQRLLAMPTFAPPVSGSANSQVYALV